MSIRFTNNIREANTITHSGKFHADDIFSIVLLEKILGDVTVFRTQYENLEIGSYNPNTIVFDIGFGKFDHHQKDGNGFHPTTNTTLKPIPYASLGLLWKEFGLDICKKYTENDIDVSKKLWNDMEDFLVIGIDAFDNGIYSNLPGEYATNRLTLISQLISYLNPTSDEEDLNILLIEATSLARFVFDTSINYFIYKYNNPHYSIRQNPKYFLADQVFANVVLKQIYNNNCSIESFEKNYCNDFFKKENPTFKEVWKSLGKMYCTSISVDKSYIDYTWGYIMKSLVIGIDAYACGFLPSNDKNFVQFNAFTISDFINMLNAWVYSEGNYQKAYKVATDIAELIILRIVKEVKERLDSRKYVELEILKSTLPCEDEFAQSSKHILIFNKHVHWKEWVAKSELAKNIWFVISPSNNNGYTIQPVPCKYHENGMRKGFPKKWHGLNGKALQKVSKVPDATFIHSKNGFIAGASTLEGAVMLCKRAFSNNENIKKYTN